jgi:cytochrome c-type protein NapC
MLQSIVYVTAAVAIVLGLFLSMRADKLVGSTAGRLALLLGIGVLPLLTVTGGTVHAVQESSSTEFCLECHEMEAYGKSLFLDDNSVLPAVHYQKRLIERDQTCYACHTDYALFGGVSAKLNGLKHVWVHYMGEVPAPGEMELYQDYPNYNCLHCHDDARSYMEASPHEGKFEEMRAGEKSCLECHGQGHALDKVEAGEFWLGG